MAVRDDFAAGEVLAAADLNDTFASKLDLAGGKILQIVRATDSTIRSTTSTSFVDANLSVTITPEKSDSAILIIWSTFVAAAGNASTDNRAFLQITDNSNNPISGAQDTRVGLSTASQNHTFTSQQTLIGYATPATTSAVTYKARFRSSVATTTSQLVNSTCTAQLYAIEVSA